MLLRVTGVAEIRASQMKANLVSLSGLGPEVERDVRAALASSIVSCVEEATRVAWMPIELDIELTETVARCAGTQALCDWSKDSMKKSLESPFLKPVLDAAVAIFGLRPAGLLKFFPRGWGQVYRNCGELSFSTDNRSWVELHHIGAPAEVARSTTYQRGVAASFSATFDICRVDGAFDVSLPEPDRVVYRARWGKRAA